jgi:GDPmannose 4,6-dehydratase
MANEVDALGTVANEKKIAFITGITGQDGSYLAELLLEKGYLVYGILRRTSQFNTTRIDHIRDKIVLRYGDLTDQAGLSNYIHTIIEDNQGFDVFEIYNLGAMSHVQISFEIPEYTTQVDALGTLHLLEICRTLTIPIRDKIRFYQASTSELFGDVLEIPQNENTPFNPQSPYACAKLYSHHIVKNYRDGYGMFACSGILFNHESPRRGANFVTQKIVQGIQDIVNGQKEHIELGNIYSKRDWGHAKDYVAGMWLMLQAQTPCDYVLATGTTTTVKDFINMCFAVKNITLRWQGTGTDEVAICAATGKTRIKISEKYFRPCEVNLLLGDSGKVRAELGWKPTHDLNSLINDMFDTL